MIPEANKYYQLHYVDNEFPIYSYIGSGRFTGKTTVVEGTEETVYLFDNLFSQKGYTNEAYFSEKNIQNVVAVPTNVG